MIPKSSKFNEIFLSDVKDFDIGKYCINLFFDSEKERRSAIIHEYAKRNTVGALNYMFDHFHEWKNNRVNPNSRTYSKIISATIPTFTDEEKFVEAYSKLAKHIRVRIPNRIKLNEIDKVYFNILELIEKFNLREASRWSHWVFSKSEEEDFQSYVKSLFKFYTWTIFNNLNADYSLFKKVYIEVSSPFVVTKFKTYLFNIEIDLGKIGMSAYQVGRLFNVDQVHSYDDLMNHKLSSLSITQISEISKANNTTKIDAFISETDIGNIIKHVQHLKNSKSGGSIKSSFRTNSGLLSIDINILSFREQVVAIIKLVAYVGAICLLYHFCIVLTTSYFIFVFAVFILSVFMYAESENTLNVIRSLFKMSNGRK